MAARRFESDYTLLTRLARSVTSLTWRALQSIPRSKSVVQSLILRVHGRSLRVVALWMWATCGLVQWMQISIQMGLNRPMNPQDFTKFRIKLNDKEVAERVRTWAACKVVAQRYDIRYLSFDDLTWWKLVKRKHRGRFYYSSSVRLGLDFRVSF